MIWRMGLESEHNTMLVPRAWAGKWKGERWKTLHVSFRAYVSRDGREVAPAKLPWKCI